jgi:hypothetical protein
MVVEPLGRAFPKALSQNGSETNRHSDTGLLKILLSLEEQRFLLGYICEDDKDQNV